MLAVKCYGECGEKFEKSEMLQISGKNYCEPCYSKKTKDTKDREELYQYLQKTYNLSFPTGLMLRQIKTLKEERGYTYKNIRFTLDYIFNIRKAYSPDLKFGIAMVPHFYDEMIGYYKNLSEKRASTVIRKIETKVVVLEKPPENDGYSFNKFIDMTKLLSEAN